MRLRRLTGVVLKEPFGVPSTRNDHVARHSWEWKPWNDVTGEQLDLTILEDICWECRDKLYFDIPDERASFRFDEQSWDSFASECQHECGLYKLLAVWLTRKLRGEHPGTLKAMLNAPESPKFGFGLDLGDWVSQSGLVALLTPTLGLPLAAVAVPLTIIMATYGVNEFLDFAEDDTQRAPDEP